MSNLFGSEYGSYIVSHTLAATCTEDRVAFPLATLIGAGDAHSSGDDAVGLQHMDHFGILL